MLSQRQFLFLLELFALPRKKLYRGKANNSSNYMVSSFTALFINCHNGGIIILFVFVRQFLFEI